MTPTPCAVCPGKFRPLPADGPQPARILLVGERPGRDENRIGRPFVGRSGQELDQTYLPLAKLDRSEVRVTNCVQCWAENDRTPTPREIEHCSRHHLPYELDRTQPDIVLLLGASALQVVTAPRPLLDTHHGFPQHGSIFDWTGTIIALHHPALGMHESRFMTQMLEDWACLHQRLYDRAKLSQQPVTKRSPYYQTTFRPTDYLTHPHPSKLFACDTEDHGGVPFSVQISRQPDHGILTLAQHTEAMASLADFAQHSDATWVFHNAAHDLAILAKLGIHPRQYRDTQQESFHLGNLPQGLKPLVYRLFRHTMTSWDDVVRPYSLEALTVWLVEALDIARKDLSLIEVKRLKTKIRETVKKGPLEQLLKRIIIHAAAAEYDCWQRLDTFWADPSNEWMTSHVEARLGPYPILGIANAPLPKAVVYGCSDADWTLQTAQELSRRRSDGWAIDPSDRDE